VLPTELGKVALFRAPPRASREGLEGPELFRLELHAAKGVRLDTIEQVVEGTLLRLQQAGPTDAEFARARDWLRADRARPRTALERASRAGELAELPRNLRADDELATLTREDVRRLLAREFVRGKRTVVELYPPEMLRAPAVVPERFHLVKPGDTLTGIAHRYGVPLAELVTTNGLRPKAAIFPGQKLRLPAHAKAAKGKPTQKAPPLRSHRVVSGDTLTAIAKRYRVSVSDLRRQNGLNPKKPLKIGQQLTVPPAP
jgi:LysM repeat protein